MTTIEANACVLKVRKDGETEVTYGWFCPDCWWPKVSEEFNARRGVHRFFVGACPRCGAELRVRLDLRRI